MYPSIQMLYPKLKKRLEIVLTNFPPRELSMLRCTRQKETETETRDKDTDTDRDKHRDTDQVNFFEGLNI